jgi:hypothetical protein
VSKKPDTASALAGILKAKRGDDDTATPAPAVVLHAEPEKQIPPSPAPLATPSHPVAVTPPASKKPRGGKSSDTANYSQYSVYLRKTTRKKVGRKLDDMESEQDFSDLVEMLLEQWLTIST